MSKVIPVWSSSLDLLVFMIDFSSFYTAYSIHHHNKHGHFMWLLCIVVIAKPCSTTLIAYILLCLL